MEPVEAVSVYQAVLAGLKGLAGLSGRREQRSRDALLAVYTAASETKSYVTGLKRRKRAAPAREAQLARLWGEAAVRLRRLDRTLAEQCLRLGESLAGATAWSAKEADQTREAVADVFEQVRRLL